MLRLRLKLIASLLVAPLFLLRPSQAQQGRKIALSQLEEMFSNIRSKTKWNIDGPMLWGYFFFDDSTARLNMLAEQLAPLGYRIVGVSQVEGRTSYRLHVEKVEMHSPVTLHARNNEFYALAEKLHLASYDGMDVGPTPGVKQ